MIKYALPVLLLLLAIPLSIWQYANEAYNQHLIPPKRENLAALSTQTYARAADRSIPPGAPVVAFVPLNGTPLDQTHASYRNAAIALEFLQQIPDHPRYLLLSEGYTGDPCISGAEITMLLLGLQKGLNTPSNVTVILEEEATTTYENISFSTPLLTKQFQHSNAYIVIIGLSQQYDIQFPIDVGHGARATMLAQTAWHRVPQLHLVGFLPTTLLDNSLPNYDSSYNAFTMSLASMGALGLPRFDRNDMRTPQTVCANK